MDYNEKIQWMKLYSDISKWTDLADKYKVREYVKQCGLSDILVKLYGVWKDANSIDYIELPDKFVLKTNHGYCRNIIVTDKNHLDIEKTNKQLNSWVRTRYGLVSFEPHYWKINRCIIAEEYLQDISKSNFSKSLVDYKFWCIHGEPYIVMVLYDRKRAIPGQEFKCGSPPLRASVYDINWNPRHEIMSGELAREVPIDIPPPNHLDRMLKICRILSKPFVSVRVDLYEVNNKVYFGELTFTPGGNMNYFTPEFFLEMGKKMDLSRIERKKGTFKTGI